MLTRLSIATLALFGLTASASAISVQVTIESLSPAGGTVLTPIWVGFHDGSFDSYNGNLTSQEGLERVAEDGDTARLSEDFLQGETYVQGGVSGEFGGAQDGA
ncbi:MAG: spondin domain-containing protein, partial [Planctomycetota bacterium]